MKARQHGVNLGGWLIVEKWMTPSLFAGLDAVDEYTLSSTAEGRERIRQHRRTFITKKDIKWLAGQDVGLVRVPVGYWLFREDPPYVSGIETLDNCVRWCEVYGIKILIDLHAVPGSQNGHDHSGRVGPIDFWRAGNQDDAIETLKTIATRYSNSPALWGIQLLNEPEVGLRPWRLRRWYRQAYDAIDTLLPDHVRIVFSDGYRPRLLSGALHSRPRAVMDIHHYQFATQYVRWSRLSMKWYQRRLRRRQRLMTRLSRAQPIMIGEWSAVLGRELLQAENIQDQEYKHTLLPWHVDAQTNIFHQAIALCYWSYKTEQADDPWNFRTLVEQGFLRYNGKNE